MLWRVNLYFILPPGWMPPWLWHRRPSPPRLPPSLRPSVSPSVPSTAAIPALFLSSWHRPRLSAAAVGAYGSLCQAPPWRRPRKHLDTCTWPITHKHTHRHTFYHSPHYHTTCTPDRGGGDGAASRSEHGGWGGEVTWCCCFTLERHPSVLERLLL